MTTWKNKSLPATGRCRPRKLFAIHEPLGLCRYGPPAKPRLKGRSALTRHNLEVGLVNPTPLVPGAGKDLIDGLPEAECAVADGEIRRDLEATPLDVDEKFAPALRALPHPGLETDEFLLALGCGADQHKHAFGVVFHSRL